MLKKAMPALPPAPPKTSQETPALTRRAFWRDLAHTVARTAGLGWAGLTPLETSDGQARLWCPGLTVALPVWHAPQPTPAFQAVCHLYAGPWVAPHWLRQQFNLPPGAVIASDPTCPADAYILWVAEVATLAQRALPTAPTLWLVEGPILAAPGAMAALAAWQAHLPLNHDVFVGDLATWANPSSPVYGRIALFLGQF